MHLYTLGHPALRRSDGTAVPGLRRKDVALLVYLCVEGGCVHSRSRLAGLLWGESPEERARHSLTQALGRLSRVIPEGSMAAEKESVRWRGGLPCDAATLLRGVSPAGGAEEVISLYPAHFLEGFTPGAGAEEFVEWCDRTRVEVRDAALRLLEHAAGEAERSGAWAEALRLAERAVQIDPVWEQAHRRIMRLQAAHGERNRALRHYAGFEGWLAEEVGGRPDPDTRALAEALRAAECATPRPIPPTTDGPPRHDAAAIALDPPGDPVEDAKSPASCDLHGGRKGSLACVLALVGLVVVVAVVLATLR